MIQFDVKYKIHDLPVSGFTLSNLYKSLVANLRASIEDTLMPAKPIANVSGGKFAPWVNGSTWYVWNGKTYRPVSVSVGSVKLDATLTANRTQDIQNANGTIALLSDVYGANETVILPDGAVGVDWDVATNFKCVIKRTTYFHMQHSKPGMEIRILVVNNGTNNTVLWDDLIKWPIASIPPMPSSYPGASASMLVTIRNVGGTLYAESVTQPASVL